MSSWMNDAAVQNHNAAGFNHLDPNAGGAMLDPNAFMNNPSSFDPSQFQNQQLQQRMQNGGMRNGSPAFNAPVYQTNSVIPSKRPRPREDSLGTSPRQAPGMLPNSRSQTPQQNAYPGFQQNNVPPQHAPQQTPYSHLQNGSANASPSPIMNNQLRPGGVPQRVSTASPHPFSPAAQQFPQASPSQSEHGSRVDTPQNNNNPYPQNPGFPQGYNQNFTPPPGRTSAPPQSGMSTPHMQQSQMQQPQMFPQGQQPPGQQPQQRPQNTLEQQKMLYQMQLQQQLQQRNLMNAQRGNMPPGASPMAKGPMQGPNGQMAGMRPQQTPSQARPNTQIESFMKQLVSFMQQRSLPLDLNPVVGDRQIQLITLYMAVNKFGGYKKVTSQNGWGQVAQALQFNPMQQQVVPQQLKGHYERNLLMFEEAWALNQQRQRAAMMQNPNMAGAAGQMSPTKQMNPQAMQQQSQAFIQQQQLLGQQQHLQQQAQQSTPAKQMSQMHHPQQPAVNGFSTPQPPQGQPHPMGPQSHARNSLSRSIDATPPQNGASFPIPSPISASKAGGLAIPSPHVDAGLRPGVPPAPQEFNLPAELDPKLRVLDTHGGIQLESLAKLGEALQQIRPVDAELYDLGVIDIHALTMSLQSGLHAEVRLALDVLIKLSLDGRMQLDLRACEDLVETLIDCAEMQVEMLAENTAEVSDVMLITSYEDVVRACRAEHDVVQDIAAYNTLDYDLDRAVDKLICITTIMRNYSFYETNHTVLADELVIKFLCVVIRYLGTRNMLLRSNQNTLDFMKDVIIFLSNLAQNIELPGREQALCLLHFLLAFAPCPPPNSNEVVSFSSYDPALHRYLPPAVDGLAKLLARDEPNRTHYKTIFASDVASTPPFDLLTRTFALSIAGIPDDKQDSKRGNLVTMVESRKPFLMQGMLAAEILSNLAPGYETGVAKSWLTSEDGFSSNLCRLILSLCLETTPPAHPRAPAIPKGVEDEAILHITMGGVAVLRRLAEKSRDPEDPNSNIPLSGLPAKERLLEALRIVQPKVKPVLKQLCAYAGLGT
ncbi:probable SWI1 Component of SWI/SNF global transcription activator complex [Phialocephala subalpina]|uniref:Probable SWI1 Component of SWI/SNF global transcription activator complex n=1 Tax=Phialocephala subalpina TaxID=576137 RepID=A0A1L7XGV3_9HELO|nr:probable SWI1 Component of SWI/SNF global transcription activator complex [Phialocephala subalpina]